MRFSWINKMGERNEESVDFVGIADDGGRGGLG